ncbi:helix-turn-helix domain-containing protein [Candidatus Microgenomates bacterium]|nr:helix-turn-helix domain-containing protein [Candidatus Microgenomates bacterium]
MKTLGEIIQEARKKHRVSIDRLSFATKIKPRYILAIEKGEWQMVPNFAVARGFVRNIAGAVGVSEELALALLRRDFAEEEKVETVVPRAIWTPRLTIAAVAVFTIGLLVFYLTKQYLVYAVPPPLTVGMERKGDSVLIKGTTNADSRVVINNEVVLVEDNGSFQFNLTAQTGTTLTIEALSRSGKATRKEVAIP